MCAKRVVWLKIVPLLLLLFSFTGRAVADTVVKINVYEDDVLLPDEETSFGLTAKGDSEAVPIEPPSSISRPIAFFVRPQWPSAGKTTNLKVDERLPPTSVTPVYWYFTVKVPSGYTKKLTIDFDATAFSSGADFGNVVMTGGIYNNKSMIDKPYQGDDRLEIVGNVQYVFTFSKAVASQLTVNFNPLPADQNFSGGKWALKSESPAVWRDSGASIKYDVSGGTVSDTVIFKPVAGYSEPDEVPFVIGSLGKTVNAVYSLKIAEYVVMNYRFVDSSGKAMTPPDITNTFWKLKKQDGNYVQDGGDINFKSGQKLNWLVPNGTYTVEISDVSGLAEAWNTPVTFDANLNDDDDANDDSKDITVTSRSTISRDLTYVYNPATVAVSSSSLTMFDKGDTKTFTFSMDKKPVDDMVVTLALTGSGASDVTLSGTGVNNSQGKITFDVDKDTFPAKGLSKAITVTSNDIASHTSFDLSLNVKNASSSVPADPRYDGEVRTVKINLLNKDVPAGSGLAVVPTAIDLGKIKAGEEVNGVILVKNTGDYPEPKMTLLTTDPTGQVFADAVSDVDAKSTEALTFSFKASRIGPVTGAELLVQAANRSDAPIVATIPLTVEVVDADDTALRIDPAILAARPDDAVNNKVEVEFEVVADIGKTIPGSAVSASFTFPSGITLKSSSNLFGDGAVADNGSGSYTFSSSTTLTTSAKQLLFKGVAEVDTSITGTGLFQLFSFSSFSVGGTNYGSQNAVFGIDNAMTTATLDVDESGGINSADLTYIFYGAINSFTKNDPQRVAPASFPLTTQQRKLIWDNVQAGTIKSDIFDVDESGAINSADLTYIFYGVINAFTKNDPQKVAPASFPLNSQQRKNIWDNVQKALP